jgi:hypothetical protein
MPQWDSYGALGTLLGNLTLLGRDDGQALPENEIKTLTPTKLLEILIAAGGVFGSAYNYLINGGFDFAKRQAPGTLTTIADNKYSADRWRVTRENADVQYIRVDATSESGLTSRYYGQFKKITNAGKLHICQIVEGVNSVPLRGKTVIFQAKMKASGSKTIRMAVLELQNAGTMDTIPATLVTAFNVDSTDPTLGTNVAVVTGAQSKNVTTAWQSFSVSITVPNNSKNLICAIWSDADFAANDTLSIAEAGLFAAATIQAWTPELLSVQNQLCNRFFWTTFPKDVAPAQAAGQSGALSKTAIRAGAVTDQLSNRFPTQMRVSPTITFFNPVAANAEVRDATGSVDCSSTILGAYSNQDTVLINTTGNAGSAIGNVFQIHITADAEL